MPEDIACRSFRGWHLLELLESATELVGTGGALGATADTVETADDVVNLLTLHQQTDALQVTMTTTQEENLLDNVVLVGRHINEL